MIFVSNIQTCYCNILSAHPTIMLCAKKKKDFNGNVFQYNKTLAHLEPLNIRNVHNFLHVFKGDLFKKLYS